MSLPLPPPLPREKRRELAEKCVQLRDAPDRRVEYLAARRELVESLTRLIYAVAAQRCGPDDEAEDLLGELTIAALEAVDNWRPGGMAIASWVRWKVSMVAVEESSTEERLPSDLVAPTLNPESSSLLGDELEQLPENERLALLRRYVCNASFQQIANELGVDVGTAYRTVERAIARLNDSEDISETFSDARKIAA